MTVIRTVLLGILLTYLGLTSQAQLRLGPAMSTNWQIITPDRDQLLLYKNYCVSTEVGFKAVYDFSKKHSLSLNANIGLGHNTLKGHDFNTYSLRKITYTYYNSSILYSCLHYNSFFFATGLNYMLLRNITKHRFTNSPTSDLQDFGLQFNIGYALSHLEISIGYRHGIKNFQNLLAPQQEHLQIYPISSV